MGGGGGGGGGGERESKGGRDGKTILKLNLMDNNKTNDEYNRNNKWDVNELNEGRRKKNKQKQKQKNHGKQANTILYTVIYCYIY